jgi:putative transposase
VLVAWGITTAGKPVLLGLEPGNAESTDAWASFFGGLKARGLRDPLLVVSDGGAGLIGAIELGLNCPGSDGGLGGWTYATSLGCGC